MPKYPLPILKGRGAQINTPNRFEKFTRSKAIDLFGEEDFRLKTQEILIEAKSIVNKVESPDVPLNFSLNPYQGCEHGCIYCYARNSHNYWGYSAGVDFESKIMIKKNAALLLEKKLRSRSWDGSPIMLSGNTDCYQPLEKKYRLTRSLLNVFKQYGNPVGIITKNDLILRDLDILRELNKYKLVKVVVSINGIDEDIRRMLEPRTTSYKKRLELVKKLSDCGIPVTVLAAPIIPGLNDHNIMDLVKAAAEYGAADINHIIVRLNGDLAELFEDWIFRTFPDRATKVLNQIRSVHGGKLSDSVFNHRMTGSGQYAEIIKKQFEVAKNRYFVNPKTKSNYNRERYQQLKKPQLSLFP